MKKTLLSLSVLCTGLFVLPSCEKLDEVLDPSITVKVIETPVQVPPVTTTEEQELGRLTVSYNLDSVIRAETDNRFDIDDIDSVSVEEISLSLTNADEQNNLSNFERVQVLVSNSSHPEPVVIAEETNSDGTGVQTTISLDPQKVEDLRGYLRQSDNTYILRAKARRTTGKVLTGNLVVRFRIGL